MLGVIKPDLAASLGGNLCNATPHGAGTNDGNVGKGKSHAAGLDGCRYSMATGTGDHRMETVNYEACSGLQDDGVTLRPTLGPEADAQGNAHAQTSDGRQHIQPRKLDQPATAAGSKRLTGING